MKRMLSRITALPASVVFLTLGLCVVAMFFPHYAGLGLIGGGVVGAVLDARLEFADATAVNAVAGTALIGNVVDLQAARDIGTGRPVYLVITTDTTIITGGGAGTVAFKLVSDAQAAIAVDGTASVHFATAAFVTGATSAAQITAGGVIACIALPMQGVVYEEFLGILCVTATTTTTAGKINAFLTLDPTRWQSYPNAVNG